MDRDFILPVSFAAAFHAALLFGFPKAPAPATVVHRVPIGDLVRPPLPPEPPENVEVADTESREERRLPEVAPPRGAEPPAVILEPTDFPTPTPPVLPNIDPNATRPPLSLPRAGPGTPGSIVPKELLDRPPHARFQPAPAYPFEAKREGLRGDVLVEFSVDPSGHVYDVRVVSSNHRIFEEPTLRAVARWVFEPGRRNGEVVRFRMAVPVVFNLSD